MYLCGCIRIHVSMYVHVYILYIIYVGKTFPNDTIVYKMALFFFQDELQNAAKTNRYAARKSFVISTFDVSLFVANMSQLVTVVDLGGVRDGMYLPYYEATVGLLVTSLVLQVIFAIMMIWIWIIERRKEQKCPNHGQAVNNGPPTTPPTPTPGGCCGNGLRSKCCRSEWAERLDEIGLVIVFLTIILNIVITSLGLTGNVPNELSQSQTRVT